MQWRHWHSSYYAQYILVQAQSRNPRKEETVWEGQVYTGTGKRRICPRALLTDTWLCEGIPTTWG